MSIVVDGIDLVVPGIRTVSWKEDPSFALAVPNDGAPRSSPRVTGITLHTTMGACGLVRPGMAPSRDIARKNATYWRRSSTRAGAHLLVDTDGLVACTCDLLKTSAYHAGSVNGFTVGIEICQAKGAVLYAEQLQVVVRLVDFLTAVLGIQRQTPDAFKGRIARLAKHGGTFNGVFGHRDQTSDRGRGDPGDEIFNLLAAAGYERFDLAAGDDLAAWKVRQRDLGMPAEQADGIPGETTRSFLRAAGHADGIWVARPAFEPPAPPALEGVSFTPEAGSMPAMPAEYDFPSELAHGATGRRVKLLQELLALAGRKVALDGTYGPATEGAVRSFQQSVGMPPTGVVDANTWGVLKSPIARALNPLPADGELGELVVRYAEQHLALHPVEVGGENRGPWVRLYTDGKDGRPYAWCAAFALYLLRQAAGRQGVPMPLQWTLGCDEIASDARKRKQFVSGTDLASGKVPRSALRPGTLFLVRESATNWTHTGVVVRADAESFETIEGNTFLDGSREGDEACRRHRAYPSHDFAVLSPLH